MKKFLIGIAAALVVAVAGIAIYSAVSDNNVKESEYAQNTVKTEENKEDKNNTAEADGGSVNNTAASSDKNVGAENKDADTKPEEDKKVYTPTFMYFISESDEKFEETNKMIEELKKEYGEKVNFDIVNIDKNPEAKENFTVEGQTPALIMLNTSNDISAFNFKCSDKNILKEAIEAALK